jgi:hypothetical protein
VVLFTTRRNEADGTVALAGSQQGVSDAKFLRRGQISEVSGKWRETV